MKIIETLAEIVGIHDELETFIMIDKMLNSHVEKMFKGIGDGSENSHSLQLFSFIVHSIVNSLPSEKKEIINNMINEKHIKMKLN